MTHLKKSKIFCKEFKKKNLNYNFENSTQQILFFFKRRCATYFHSFRISAWINGKRHLKNWITCYSIRRKLFKRHLYYSSRFITYILRFFDCHMLAIKIASRTYFKLIFFPRKSLKMYVLIIILKTIFFKRMIFVFLKFNLWNGYWNVQRYF